MATKNDKSTPKQTTRERMQAGSDKKPRRLRRTANRASKPLGIFTKFVKKLKIPLPNNKFGKITRKIGRIIGQILLPQFLRNSWAEIRQATWPNRRETIRLSFAVFVFAAIFSVIVAGLDLGLDKLFREYIIKV